MASWKGLRTFSSDGNPPPLPIPKEIEQDARAFYQTLPEVEKARAKGDDSAISYLEDGTGQHAVVINASDSHEFWHYALIYDKNNRRIKVLKYSTGWSIGC